MDGFALDKPNAKWMGVCAGLARATGTDPFWIRIGAVALTFLTAGLIVPALYVAAGLLAPSR